MALTLFIWPYTQGGVLPNDYNIIRRQLYCLTVISRKNTCYIQNTLTPHRLSTPLTLFCTLKGNKKYWP